MNSKDPNFDWHKPGIWVMCNPAGVPMLDAVNASPWGCRSDWQRQANGPWSRMAEQGWYVQEFVPAIPTTLKTSEEHATANESYWRYTEPAPKGVKLSLLTRGRIQIAGEWIDDGSIIAWAPLIKRNKELERSLNLDLL